MSAADPRRFRSLSPTPSVVSTSEERQAELQRYIAGTSIETLRHRRDEFALPSQPDRGAIARGLLVREPRCPRVSPPASRARRSVLHRRLTRLDRARVSPPWLHAGDSSLRVRRRPAPLFPIFHSRNGEERDCVCHLGHRLRPREVATMSLQAGQQPRSHARRSRPLSSGANSRKALYTQRSTIFPNVALDFISSWAARIS